MNETFDPKALLKIDKRAARRLVVERRELFLASSNRDVRILPASAPRPKWLVRCDPAAEWESAVADLTAEAARTPRLFGRIPAAYDGSNSAWDGATANRILENFCACFEACQCDRDNGYRSCVWYEHNTAADHAELARAIDFTKEGDGWHDKPEGGLSVFYHPAAALFGMGTRFLSVVFASLPFWTVKVPASYAQRATRAPYVSINTVGTGAGRTRIGQPALRTSDVRSVFEFLKLPEWVYTREVPLRFTPKGYLDERFERWRKRQ